ncbi:3'-5' RNA nuclease TATDN2-like [Glandiceps talaboti]
MLMESSNIDAVGEVGLDYTTPESAWPKQKELLEEILQLLQEQSVSKPLVLHIRGGDGDSYGHKPGEEVLQLVRKYCPREQFIHFHCFSGDAPQIQLWLTHFPNTYFGCTASVRHATPLQVFTISQVPEDRLIWKTDSPYFPPPNCPKPNSPQYIGSVGFLIATIRGSTPHELLPITVRNTRTLYGFL